MEAHILNNYLPIELLLDIYNHKLYHRWNKKNIPFAKLSFPIQLFIMEYFDIRKSSDFVFHRVPGYEYIYITKSGIVYDSYLNIYRYKHIYRYKTNGKWYPSMLVTYNNHQQHNEYLHRLLGLSFIPRDPKYDCINHIDGDKTNYSLDNLEWVTRSDNNKHAMRTFLNSKSSIHPMRKIKTIRVSDGAETVYVSIGECAEKTGLTVPQVYGLCNNKNINTRNGIRYQYYGS